MVLQSSESQLSVIKRQSRSFCSKKSWISNRCFTADLVLIKTHDMCFNCVKWLKFLLINRRSTLQSWSIFKAFLVTAGNVVANCLRSQMESAE